MTDITDKSLLRCTVKKSLDVTKKLVLYAAIVIDALAALWLAMYGAFGVWSVLSAPVASVAVGVVAFLFAIPWYVYTGIVAVAAIPVYSFVWCVARELTEEDKTYGENQAILFIVSLLTWAGCAVIVTAARFDCGLWLLFLVISLVAAGLSGIYIGDFIASYEHYYNRIREGANKP